MRAWWYGLPAVCLGLAGVVMAQAGQGPDVPPQITRLEKGLFDAKLTPEQVAHLLEQLKDPARRPGAAARLAAEGQGHVDRIIAFAARCRDMEARHACADAVEALDAAYRTTETGRRLGELYRARTDALLPERWKRFRKDPNDARAIAMLMHADPEKVYAWLGTSKDRHDRVRYLALRVRELTPDEFAARHLGEHTATALNLVLREVCHCAKHRDGPVVRGHAHRAVGHTLLKVVCLQSDKEFGHTAEGQLPQIQSVTAYRRWDFFATALGGSNLNLMVDMYIYYGQGVSPRGTRRGGLVRAEGLCPLVELKLTQDQCMQWILPRARPPWWMEPYVPAAWRGQLSFSQRGEGEAVPEAVVPEKAAVAQTPAPEGPAAPAQPAPAEVSPEEAAARRMKAEAELKIAEGFRKKTRDRDDQAALKWFEHAEAACRLDPTFEEAAYERSEALSNLSWRYLSKHRTAEKHGRQFTLALEYVERFGAKDRNHAAMVHDRVRVAVASAGGLSNYTPRLAPVLVEHVETLKRLLVHALDHDLHGSTPDYHQYMLSVIYRAMAQKGVAVGEREKWADDMLARADKQSERLRTGKDPRARDRRLANYTWMRFRAIELALSDGRRDRARKLWAHVQELYEHQGPPGGSQLQWMRSVLSLADEGEWLAEFDRWRKELAARVVSLLPIRFPEIDVYRKPKDRGGAVAGRETLHVQVSSLRIRAVALADGRASNRLRPLAVGDGVLYVMIRVGRERGLVGAIPLDATDRPVGKLTSVKIEGIRYDAWDSVRALPRPPYRREYEDVVAVRYARGKLYLATRESGLLVFDAKTEKWASYGPEQGLPGAEVASVAPLDERTLLCTSGGEKTSHFTLDLADGKVQILRTRDWEKRVFCPPLLGVWRDGEKLMGWDCLQLWTDLLAPGVRTRRCLDGKLAYGWQGKWAEGIEITAVLERAGRRFVAGPSGLHEFDPAGRVVRSWWSGHSISPEGAPRAITLPPTSPGYGYNHVRAGPLLYSFNNSHAVAYRPETETWYGPLVISASSFPRGTRDGIWGAGFGLDYVRNEDFLAKAQELGRVMTSAEYLKRRDAVIEAMPELERAKVCFAMRRFDDAKRLLDQITRAEPEHAEALLLLGWLHDAWCTDRPDEARRYYGRLAGMEDNRNACFSGLYMEFEMLARGKKWKELIGAGDRICARFPQIQEYQQSHIDWWRKHAREEMGAKDGVRP